MTARTISYPTFTAPAVLLAKTDYELGRVAYLTGKRFYECTSAEMRDGWTKAAGDAQIAFLRCVNWNSEAVR